MGAEVTEDVGVNNKRLFIKRFLVRLSNLLRFREMWGWEYESCNRCGSCYRLATGWLDSKWIEVNGRYGGCLCFDCFMIVSQEKHINIVREDIERLWVFDPVGECFNIIDPDRK